MTAAKAILTLILLVLTALSASAGGPSGQPIAKPTSSKVSPSKPSRLLVKPFKRLRADQRAAADAHRTQVGARVKKRFDALGGWEVLELPKGSDMESMRSKFIATGYYEAVEVDQEWRILATPDDPQYLNGTLWGLHNTGQAGGTTDADIDAPEGWDVRNSAQDVVVAVIDTGILATHEDLSANMWVNPGEIAANGVDDDGNGYVDDMHGVNAITGSGNATDDNGHGTHCAGTIGGVGNNGIGVTGVAWRVKLMACKFLSAQGSGTTSDAIEAIDYARRNGADIMSNSWGGGGYSQALFDAIAAARDAGIVFVAAAGNSALDNDVQANYPSNYLLENVLAVAATDRSEGIANFSNFGSGMVELGAPGVDIRSTVSSSNTAYDTYSGTSMATPHVSGALALVAAQFPNDTARMLINRICRSVDTTSSLSGKTATGGRLNVLKALNSTSNAPFNDAFASAARLATTSSVMRASNTGASMESGEPSHAQAAGVAGSVWWTWTAPVSATVTIDLEGSSFDTVLSVYSGTAVNSLSEVAGNDDAPGRTTSRVTFSAVQGTAYRIAVAGKGQTGLILLRVSTPPPFDLFGSPATLTGDPATLTTTNVGAGKEPGEPNHADNAGGASVWFQWTAPASSSYRISTAGSSIDTLLGVYTGSAVGSLSLLASNDNESGSLITSALNFNAIAGTVYRIAVDGKNGASGSVRIMVSTPPSNDAFVSRLPLVGTQVATTGNNLGATKEPGEPAHAGDSGGQSVWWTWMAAGVGSVEINTNGSDFDTTLGVYTGSGVSALTQVAGDDDSGDGFASRVVFNPSPGTVYQIAVDGFGGDAGSIQLAVVQSALNSPPSVTDAVINPTPEAWSDQEIRVTSVSSFDPEGDPVTLAYQWQFSTDGTVFANSSDAITSRLPIALSNLGKRWRCQITPSDAISSGAPFFTQPLDINRRPTQIGKVGQPYFYDSDLFVPGSFESFPRSAIINEFSQGPSGASSEWIEILFLRSSDARGWTLRDVNSSNSVIFNPTSSLWQSIPAGTLLVIYNGGSKDPALPPDDTDASDGALILSSSSAPHFSGSWPILSNSNADGFAVRDLGGSLVDGVSINSQTSFQPALGAVSGSRSARFNGETEPAADLLPHGRSPPLRMAPCRPGRATLQATRSL